MGLYENKYTYFLLEIFLPEEDKNLKNLREKIDYHIEKILVSLKTKPIIVSYLNKDTIIRYIFKPIDRKREKQISKLFQICLPEQINYNVKAIRKSQVSKLQRHTLDLKPVLYHGPDMETLKKKENWAPWQKETYDLLYDKYDQLKPPDMTSIIQLIDLSRILYKDFFFKYLYINNPENIAIIRYNYKSESESDCRSDIINLKAKKVYIINLLNFAPIGNDINNLLSIIEDLKLGAIFTVIDSEPKELIMTPPHIILLCNGKIFSSINLIQKNHDNWINIYIDQK